MIKFIEHQQRSRNQNYSTAKIFLFSFSFLLALTSFSQVRLPKLVSDGMVLQRDTKVKIWGWATAGEKVSVHFLGAAYSSVAGPNGSWSVMLPELKAGGPHEMKIEGSNEITVRDILIGDVWICSGQSNMEFVMMSSSSIYGEEIAHAENKFIRQFTVPRKYTFAGDQQDVASGSWQSADPKTVLRFSAVTYFFAKDLYARYKIPIGLINASLGGSRAESWMSEEALKQFPNHFEEYQKYKDSAFIANVEREDRKRIAAWNTQARENDEGYKDAQGLWRKPDLNTATWDEMEVPGFWEKGKLGPVNGVVWFRKDFEVPNSMVGVEGKLHLGNIVDADSTFINGIFVGGVGNMYVPRKYNIPTTLLKPGKNTIVVRLVNNTGKGGFVPDKPYMIAAGRDTISLSGLWKYRLGFKMEPLVGPTFIMWKPGGLYNGMISPLLPYTIKGVIWYQGESNVSRAIEHRTLFPALIRNWRNKWQVGNFPFLFVQLPNYHEAQAEPSESSWAMFRESQLKTLSEPHTGMAVAIDVGEWNDIHPLNKKDIGIRLALAAQHVAYGDNKIVYSGPLYESMKVKGNRIILSFRNTGRGIVAKGGEPLKQFAIAGADKKFVWAKAVIRNNRVEVWSDQVMDPVAVRYAWSDNPDGANLFNQEGLPASPFRTDDF